MDHTQNLDYCDSREIDPRCEKYDSENKLVTSQVRESGLLQWLKRSHFSIETSKALDIMKVGAQCTQCLLLCCGDVDENGVKAMSIQEPRYIYHLRGLSSPDVGSCQISIQTNIIHYTHKKVVK